MTSTPSSSSSLLGRLPVALAAFAVLAACSSTSTNAAPPPADDAGTSDGSAEDAGAEAGPTNDPYELSVLEAKWTKAGGPTARGGGKMDDIVFTSAEVGYLADGPGATI